ncbi:MAG: hypothetical protein WKG03_02095, partial [Telluria sp.]
TNATNARQVNNAVDLPLTHHRLTWLTQWAAPTHEAKVLFVESYQISYRENVVNMVNLTVDCGASSDPGARMRRRKVCDSAILT